MTTISSGSSKAQEFRRNAPVLVAATTGCAFGLSSLPFYSLGSFVAPLQAEFGWSRTDVTSSFLYSTITLALISPLLGALIDGVGVRRLSLISIPLVSIVLFLMSRAGGSVWTFHALFALSALVGGGTTPISYTRAVNAVFDKGRGLALGISLAGIGIAAIMLDWSLEARPAGVLQRRHHRPMARNDNSRRPWRVISTGSR